MTKTIIPDRLARVSELPLLKGAHDEVARRFWSKVEAVGECWEWRGTASDQGYGAIRVNGKMIKAHRLAFELTYGEIPNGKGPHGICVLHHCDNPKCCNPAHLFLGTNQDNARDRHAKGRSKNLFSRGVRHPRFKVSSDVVSRIVSLRARGFTQQRIADHVGISRGHVAHILIREGK